MALILNLTKLCPRSKKNFRIFALQPFPMWPPILTELIAESEERGSDVYFNNGNPGGRMPP